MSTAQAPSRHRNWEVLLLSLGALLAAPLLEVRPHGRVSLLGLPQFLLPPSCASREILGVDCPGCGLTRSFIHLSHGEWQASLQCHRLGWLLMGLALVQVPYRICALGWPARQFVGASPARWIGRIVIAALFLNWVWGLISAS